MKKKKFTFWKLLLILLILAVIAAAGLYIAVTHYVSKLNFEDTSGEDNFSIVDSLADGATGVKNILLIGVDNDYAPGMDELGNADGLMIASINPKTRQVVLTSLMRDIRVQVPDSYKTKLTLSYHYGGTQQLIDTAKAHHVVYLEAMRLVFDDALPVIQAALPEIGTLRRVTMEFTQYSSRYDRVRAGEQGINAFDPALCNAAILDMGCYPIHAIVSMFGAPAHVSAEAYHLSNGFEAGGIALLRYDGFVCEAIWSKVCKQAAPTTFMGEDGSILLDDINHIRRIWLVRRNGETVELPYEEKLPNNMMYELREFAGYITSGTQPEKRNRDSVITASVIEQARGQTGTRFACE